MFDGIREKGKSALLPITFMLLFLIFPAKLFPEYFFYKQILLTALIIGGIGFQLWKKRKIDFHWLDLVFLAFVGMLFLNYFWASHPTIIWKESFNWLLLLLVYFCSKGITFFGNKRLWSKTILLTAGINLLSVSSVYIIIGFTGIAGFNFEEYKLFHHYLNYTPNMLGSMLLIQLLFIYKAYHLEPENKTISFLLAIVSCTLILGLNVRGVTLILFLLLLVSLFKNKIKIKQLIFSTLLIIAGVSVLLLVMKDRNRFISSYSLKYKPNSNDERFKLWKVTYKLFKEDPLLGKGTDHWRINYPKYGMEDFNIANDKKGFYAHAHNLYLETLAENGILGFLLLLILILYPMFLAFSRVNQFEFLVILAVFLLLVFYGVLYDITLNFHLELVVLFAWIAQLLKTNSNSHPTFLNYILLIFGFSSFVYFVDHQRRKQGVQKILRTQKITKVESEALEHLAHPIFYNYHKHRSMHNILAWASAKVKDDKKALDFQNIAVKDLPYDYTEWYNLGRKYKSIKNHELAKVHFEKAKLLNHDFYSSHIELAEIALKQKDWEAFDINTSFYFNDLFTLKTKHYTEDVWNSNDKVRMNYWTRKCRHEDRVLTLLDKKSKMIKKSKRK